MTLTWAVLEGPEGIKRALLERDLVLWRDALVELRAKLEVDLDRVKEMLGLLDACLATGPQASF